MSGGIGALRWVLKKTSRTALAHGSHAVGRMSGVLGGPSTGVVRALTYHRFGAIDRDPFCVAPDDFARQVEYLARHNLAISLDQLDRYIDGRVDLPMDSVLVTIDDGCRSTLTHAMPILRDHGVSAVAFVSADLVGKPPHFGEPEDFLDWDELQRLQAGGVTVQSHGCTHRSLGYLPPEQVRDELARSRETIAARLGTTVTAHAYPFGTRADYDERVAAIAVEAGYRMAFTSQHGAITPGSSRGTLPRIKVEAGEGLATFGALVHGGLDAWRWIDRGLWRLQASRRAGT